MSKSGLHTCLLLTAMIIALLACACRHHTGVENACAVKASVLENLRADTTTDARRFYARIDSCPLRSAHDCEAFYSIVSDATEYMGIHGNSLEASIIMRNILDILLESDNRTPQDTHQMLTLYVHLGSLFTDMGMPNIGIDYYMTGLKYCRDSTYDNFKAMLCNNMGILYAQRSQVERAEEYFLKALAINQDRNNHHATFINYGNLTELYALQGETQKALETSQRSLDYLDQNNHPDHLASMRIQQGVLYTRLKQYDMALMRFNSGVEQYRQLANARGVINGYLLIAENFLHWGYPDSAMVYAAEARRLCQRHVRDDDMISALKTLAEVYQAKKMHENALMLMNEMTALSDSIRSTENALRMANWENISSAMLPESAHSHSASGSRTTVAMTIAAAILLIMAVSYLKLKHRYKRQISDAAHSEYEYSRTLNKLNRELTTLSLEKLKLHEGLSEICTGLRSVLLELNPRESVKRENIRTQLNRLNALTDYDADGEFKLYFERVHPDFYRNLTALDTELTGRDMRLCALLYLGLNTKEIATLTYREIRSVESARNRLRKKLGLKLTDDLTAYLHSLG